MAAWRRLLNRPAMRTVHGFGLAGEGREGGNVARFLAGLSTGLIDGGSRDVAMEGMRGRREGGQGFTWRSVFGRGESRLKVADILF